MTMGGDGNGKDKLVGGDPWAQWRRPDRPDSATLKYSDSPYAPDWAKRPSLRINLQAPAPPADAPPGETTPGSVEQIAKASGQTSLEQTAAPVADNGDSDSDSDSDANDLFRPDPQFFEEALFALTDDDRKLYALIDGEWCRGAYGRLMTFDLPWAGLWQGDLAKARIKDAPFVVALEPGHKLTRWLIEERWGMGCVVFLTASTEALTQRYARQHRSLAEDTAPRPGERRPFIEHVAVPPEENAPIKLLRRHLRRFTEVEFEDDGRLLDFRFCDPAVLRTYLMSCNAAELAAFFGPVTTFLMENYSPVESLNRPDQALQFFRLVETYIDENGYVFQDVSRLEAHLIDLVARQSQPLALPPMQTEKPARKTIAGHVMIRKGQVEAFQEAEMAMFDERVALNLGLLASRIGRQPQFSALRQFSANAVARARGKGLTSELELMAYAQCGALLGLDFDESEDIKMLLAQRAGEAEHDLGDALRQVAKQAIHEMGIK